MASQERVQNSAVLPIEPRFSHHLGVQGEVVDPFFVDREPERFLDGVRLWKSSQGCSPKKFLVLRLAPLRGMAEIVRREEPPLNCLCENAPKFLSLRAPKLPKIPIVQVIVPHLHDSSFRYQNQLRVALILPDRLLGTS